jgi:hypothetical protein
MKQWDVTIGSYHQRKTDDSQIVAPFFAMAALRQLRPIIEAINKSKKVGGIEKQASQIKAEPGYCGRRNILFDFANLQLVDAIHVIPETLAGKL